jgi:hypothetical protein
LIKQFVVAGLVLTVVGTFLIILAFVNVAQTHTLLDETQTIEGYHFYSIGFTFYGRSQMHMKFTVTGGPLDFWVMDDDEYNHFTNEEDFNYYPEASFRSVSLINTDWNPPINKNIVFVWDNHESNSKTVSIDFSESARLLVGFWGWLVLILGWLLACVGIGAIIEGGLRRKPYRTIGGTKNSDR